MNIWELLLIAVGLSMDAFAVSICKGLSMKQRSVRKSVIVGLYFGGFQAGMPLIGYLLGYQFKDSISCIDHWVAFILLGIIGINMIKGSKEETEGVDEGISVKRMVPLAVATSIDALAVGVLFAFHKVEIGPAISFIGIITFVFSYMGVILGNIWGIKFKAKAEIIGGIMLIGMGTKILLEHTGVLPW